MLECKKQREISLVCCIDRVSTRKRKRIREKIRERGIEKRERGIENKREKIINILKE